MPSGNPGADAIKFAGTEATEMTDFDCVLRAVMFFSNVVKYKIVTP
jgi:hypothetical protein